MKETSEQHVIILLKKKHKGNKKNIWATYNHL